MNGEWVYGRTGIWENGSMGEREYGRMGVWENRICEYGYTEIYTMTIIYSGSL